MRLLPVALILSACTPPVDAPVDVGEAMLHLFAHFDDEDATTLVAGFPALEAHLAALDPDSGVDERAVTPPVLGEPNLAGAVVPPGADTAVQVPVAVGTISQSSVDDAVTLALEPNQVCISSDSSVWYGRTFVTETACFADGSCDTLEVTNEIRTESILADVWIDGVGIYRRVTTDDGREALIYRTWMPEQAIADDGNNSWDQRLSLDVWVPDPANPAQTLRLGVLWSSVTITGVSDDFYAGLVTNGIQEGFDNAADFLAGGTECKNDRDREYDRE